MRPLSEETLNYYNCKVRFEDIVKGPLQLMVTGYQPQATR